MKLSEELSATEVAACIANRIWDWLQGEKNIELVPWISRPSSPQHDDVKDCKYLGPYSPREKVISHSARKQVLGELEILIQEWSEQYHVR